MIPATQKKAMVEILNVDEFQDSMETFELVAPDLENFYIPDFRRDLPAKFENPSEIGEIVTRLELLIDILEKADTVEAVATKVDLLYQEVNSCYEANIESIFSQTKPFERTVRSLGLLYQNAGGEANVFILPVAADKFADSANPKHFELLRAFLRRQYFKFKMENSPFYLGYIGESGKNALLQMSEIAELTRAMAILDIESKNNVKAMLNQANRLGTTGLAAKFGHLMIPATWLYANAAREYTFIWSENGQFQKRIERKMAVQAAAAIIGKLLKAIPGEYISGLESDPLDGIDGVVLQYNEERNDAKDLDKAGLIMIEPGGNIEGTTTCNKSGNTDLRKFPKVDTANALLKDMVQFCNNKANSKWGKKERNDFKFEVEQYLNRRMKQELIEGYSIDLIEYDGTEETVNIEITVKFYEVADTFEIHLHGPKKGIDSKNEQ